MKYIHTFIEKYVIIIKNFLFLVAFGDKTVVYR